MKVFLRRKKEQLTAVREEYERLQNNEAAEGKS